MSTFKSNISNFLSFPKILYTGNKAYQLKVVEHGDGTVTLSNNNPVATDETIDAALEVDASGAAPYLLERINRGQLPLELEDYGLVALPQYIVFYTLLGLLAVTALVKIQYLLKISIIIGLVTVQALLIYLALGRSFDLYQLVTELKVQRTYVVILITTGLALIIINRQVNAW